MSDARRRKHAVCVRAGRGVVGRWVFRKAESQVGCGVRPLVVISWAVIWVAGLDIVGGVEWQIRDTMDVMVMPLG